MKISNKVIVVLTMVALGILSCPGSGMAQAIIPVVDLGDHVWATESERGCLLGGKLNDRWLKPKETAELLRGEGDLPALYPDPVYRERQWQQTGKETSAACRILSCK